MTTWYYKINELEVGPISDQEIQTAFAEGKINGETLVKQGENGSWLKAEQVQELLKPPVFTPPQPPIFHASTPHGPKNSGSGLATQLAAGAAAVKSKIIEATPIVKESLAAGAATVKSKIIEATPVVKESLTTGAAATKSFLEKVNWTKNKIIGVSVVGGLLILFFLYNILPASGPGKIDLETAEKMARIVKAFEAADEMRGSIPARMSTNHSWRTYLLPTFWTPEEEAFFGKIRIEEPWNSEWNKQFHSRIPECYTNKRIPSRKLKSGMTNFAVVYGENAPFYESSTSTVVPLCSFDHVKSRKGKECTVFLVERKQPFCWMEPIDVQVDQAVLGLDKSESGVGGPSIYRNAMFAFFDGNVFTTRKRFDDKNLDSYLKVNSGRFVDANGMKNDLQHIFDGTNLQKPALNIGFEKEGPDGSRTEGTKPSNTTSSQPPSVERKSTPVVESQPVPRERTSSTPRNISSASSTGVAITKVSAVELMEAYTENKVKADMKYGGKTIEVSGTINEIGKSIMGSMYVSLKSNELMFGVQCMFPKAWEDRLADLQKGGFIKIRGECDGAMGNVRVRNCTIVE